MQKSSWCLSREQCAIEIKQVCTFDNKYARLTTNKNVHCLQNCVCLLSAAHECLTLFSPLRSFQDLLYCYTHVCVCNTNGSITCTYLEERYQFRHRYIHVCMYLYMYMSEVAEPQQVLSDGNGTQQGRMQFRLVDESTPGFCANIHCI